MTTHFLDPKFKPITVGSPLIELDEDIIADLSTDQKYGYRMVNAIRAGTVPVDLANLDIGPVFHANNCKQIHEIVCLQAWVF